MILSLLLVTLPAAASPPLLECPRPEDVGSELAYCSDNVDAVNTALTCYDQLADAWDDTAAVLNRTLLGVQKRSTTMQKAEEANAAGDYATAVKKLNQLIDTTRFNKERLHQYSRVMLDAIGSESFEDSSPCYHDNVLRLRNVEGQLQNMIEQGIAARDSSGSLNLVASANRLGLDQLEGNRAAAGTTAPPGAGASQNSASDVTGIAEDQRKRNLLLEAQLLDHVNHLADGSAAGSSRSPASARAPSRDPRVVSGSPGGQIVAAGAPPGGTVSPFRGVSGLGSAIDPTGTFANRGNLGPTMELGKVLPNPVFDSAVVGIPLDAPATEQRFLEERSAAPVLATSENAVPSIFDQIHARYQQLSPPLTMQ